MRTHDVDAELAACYTDLHGTKMETRFASGFDDSPIRGRKVLWSRLGATPALGGETRLSSCCGIRHGDGLFQGLDHCQTRGREPGIFPPVIYSWRQAWRRRRLDRAGKRDIGRLRIVPGCSYNIWSSAVSGDVWFLFTGAGTKKGPVKAGGRIVRWPPFLSMEGR